MEKIKLINAIVAAGGKVETRQVNGFRPDFIIDDVLFFEMKEWWRLSRVVKLDLAFPGQGIIAYITDISFLERNWLSVRDWLLGIERPLALWTERVLYRIDLKGGIFSLEPKALHSFHLFDLPF
jgi:hypothetical protein